MATNVALVVLDTARALETPVGPDPEATDPETMPTLSELATAGTAYGRAFGAAPWTLPSHASLFTGTYPSRHGAHGGHTYLDADHRLLAESFAEAGYETVGVTNNTWITGEFGFARGFETFWKGWQYWQSDSDMGAVLRAEERTEKLGQVALDLFDGNPLVNAVNLAYSELLQPTGDDGAARTTDRIEEWLRGREDERPFFLFANFIEPHVEYRPPREFAGPFLPEDARYEEARSVRQDPRAYDVGEYELTERDCRLLRALYCGELAYVDRQLDRLRNALRATGEWEDTLFVVLGDHGENVGDHGFLGHQYDLSDTLLHVPLVVHGGAFTGGPNTDRLVQLPDLVPTLLDATGIEDSRLREQSQVRSFYPGADAEPRDVVFAEYAAPQPPIERLEERFGHLPEHVRRYDRSLRTIRTPEFKYVRGSDGREELYDVRMKPRERRDCLTDCPERARRLRERLDAWLDSFEHATVDPDADVEMTEETKRHLMGLGYL
jgi:arylsulfatase A-like enzyme